MLRLETDWRSIQDNRGKIYNFMKTNRIIIREP